MAKTLFGDEAVNTTQFGDPVATITPPEPAGEPLPPEAAFERSGKVWDTALEDNVPVQVADKYFYNTANQPLSLKHPDFTNPVEDNRVGFSEEFKKQWTGKDLVTKVPVIGGMFGAAEQAGVILAANRLVDPSFDYGDYNTQQDIIRRVGSRVPYGIQLPSPSSQTLEKDQAIIAGAIKDFEREQRGLTFGGKVARGVSQLPTWMLEFFATGGLASIGDDVAKKAGEKILRNQAKTLAGRTAIKTAGLATGAVARTAGLFPRVGEKAIERQALIDIGVAEQEGWGTSLAKAWGDTVIESFSEETGGVLTKGVVGLIGKLPFGAKFLTSLQDNWIALTGKTADDFASQMLTKAGYSNILGEIGEERVGTLLREATGVSDRKGGFGERIWAGMKEDLEIENIGAELVTLLVPASVKGGMAIGQSLKKGTEVPTEAEQLDMAIDAGKVSFDSPEDAQAFAERASEVAQREGVDVTVNTDLADNSVTVEEVEKAEEAEGVIAEADQKAELNIVNQFLAENDASKGTVPSQAPFLETRDEEFAKRVNEGKESGRQSALFPDELEHAEDAIEIGRKLGYPDNDIAAYLQKNYTGGFTPAPTHPVRVVPPTVKEKQALPPDKAFTQPEKDITGVEPIDKIREALKQAKKVIPKTKAEQKKEKGRRVAAAQKAAKTGIEDGSPVEESIFKSTGLLKGPLTEYEQRFTSIENQLTASEKNAAYGKIYNHPKLGYFEVLNTTTSFKKLLAGAALTDGDVKNIERVFGKTFSDITAGRQEVSPLYDRLVTLWKAGLLTGIKTQGLNALSNMTHAMTETAKDIPGALVDNAVSLYTGERALAFTTKGTVQGTIKGIKDGWKYLRTGYSERDIGKKLDYTNVNFGTSKVAKALQAYEETIFHLLGAADQPFYYGAKARSLFSQAIAKGKNLGLKGKELDRYVEAQVKNPTDIMLDAAVHDAEVAVFQNQTLAGDIAKGLQNLPGGEIIVPFGRTPSAVATQIINYSPVGVVGEIAKQIKKGEFNQRQFSQATGRAVLGTGALYLGGQLLKAGLLTLDRPKTEKERKLWELEGRVANSIKIDGKWRSIQVLGPVGNSLIIGGHFQHHLEEEGSPTVAIGKALSGSAKSFSEQTFVRGVNQAVSALVNPERSAEYWFSSMAGSLVPTIVSDIARAKDPIQRRTEGISQRVQSRIPALREDLPPRVDVFGQDLPRYGGNVLEVMADPSRPAKIKNDIVVDELRRLADNDIKVTPTLLGGRDGFDVLTDEENTQMWRRQGELSYKILQAVITSEGYDKVDNDLAKKEMIEEVVTKSRAAAKAEMVSIKLAQGVGIIELAESGLLTIRELEAIQFFSK